MLINFEELEKNKHISAEKTINFSDRETKDALLKQVNDVNVRYSAYIIEPKDVHVSLDVDFAVDYLDAKTLEPLKVNFNFNEEVLFTTDLQRANELEIEHFIEEIDLTELIWELILVTVPYNYSENNSKNTITEQEAQEQTPFANLFNKK